MRKKHKFSKKAFATYVAISFLFVSVFIVFVYFGFNKTIKRYTNIINTVAIKRSEEAREITFDKVIAIGADDGIKVGAPYVDGASVGAKVIKNGKGKKIVVATYKPKKNEKRKMGHRQPYTKVEISAINA